MGMYLCEPPLISFATKETGIEGLTEWVTQINYDNSVAAGSVVLKTNQTLFIKTEYLQVTMICNLQYKL